MELIKRSVISSARCLRGFACRRASNTAAPVAQENSNNTDSSTDNNEAAEGGWERRLVSGLQPTGALHAGNYFGALRRCVRAQDQGENLTIFIADLHAITTQHTLGVSGAMLQERVLELAAAMLGAGVDPARSVFYAQSAVPRHAELCWLLACLCSQARLHHLPQYKEKAALVPKGGGVGDGSEVGVGLLLYPVLQAADVLLHQATLVPVGADQRHHVQLAAQLARTFTHRYGRAFPVPRATLPDDGSDRIRSLRDPTRKMSKSDPDQRAAIFLMDSDDVIREKVRKAVTDCEPAVTFDPVGRPGVANLVTLHCLAADKLPEEVVEEYAGITTGQYKKEVAEALCSALGGVRARTARWLQRPRAVRDVLRAGAARARQRADPVYERAARLAGLAPASRAPTPATHALRLQPAPKQRKLAAR